MKVNRYRSKPVEIEAVMLAEDESNAEAIATWCAGRVIYGAGMSAGSRGQFMGVDIDTLEGTMRANPGDWVIRGTEGEFCPCKPSVFERKYEPADA